MLERACVPTRHCPPRRSYLMWALVHFALELRRLLEMRTFFRDKLHIDDVDLHSVQWDTVVQRIVELQQTSRLCIVKDQACRDRPLACAIEPSCRPRPGVEVCS